MISNHQWQPIIEDAAFREKIRRKIDEIGKAVSENPCSHIGLLNGNSGTALFLFYLDLFYDDNRYEETAEALLCNAMEQINDGFDQFTFSIGIPGILWTLTHLNNEGFIEADVDFTEILPILENQMLLYAENNDFDYLHGAMGFCLYLLSHPADLSPVFRKLSQLLEEKGIQEKNCIRWQQEIRRDPFQKVYGISLSHGLSSTLVLLSKIFQKDAGNMQVKTMLQKASAYLLSQRNDPSKNLLSVYPVFGEPEEHMRESRLSWCYGDLGIAVALYETGTVLHDQQLREEALGILLHACNRRELEKNGVVDAGLCHGTAGIAHIFNRFFQRTQHPAFKEAARYWFEKTLEMATFTDGLAGFRSRSDNTWVNDTGMLEGISGIGLALISAVSAVEPKWDAALLLS